MIDYFTLALTHGLILLALLRLLSRPDLDDEGEPEQARRGRRRAGRASSGGEAPGGEGDA